MNTSSPFQGSSSHAPTGSISKSYLGSAIGVLRGINPFLAVPAAIVGNILCTFLLVALADRIRTAVTRSQQGESEKQPTKRRQRVAKHMKRFGVPGVALLGPLVLASQITAPALVALGANRRSVYIWTGISITRWGVAWGLLAEALVLWVASQQGSAGRTAMRAPRCPRGQTCPDR